MAEIKKGILINDRFEVVNYIGGGGFGQVWEGFDKQLKRKVAIKRILSTTPDVDKIKKEAVSEARKIAPLSDPHIVSVFDVLEYENEILIVMEYMVGGSLQDRLKELSKQGKWVAFPEAFRMLKEILLGLQAAHASDMGPIIHRDLKPLNILFDSRGRLKIADFGLAAIGHVSEIETINPGKWEHPGTFGYKSPEQLRGAELDPKSDLFNVGLIAYILFAALHPFIDPRFLFDYKEMVLEPYRLLPKVESEGMLPDLEKFILTLLAIDPNDRFQSASAALSELDHIEDKYDVFLLDRVITFHDSLKTGSKTKVDLTIEELSKGIFLCKKKGFYAQGAFLYEKAGTEFSELSSHLYSRLEEDYRVCRRRAGREVTPE